MLRMRTDVRHALNRGGAGADDGNAFVREVGEAAAVIAAGVRVVPPTGVERVTLEVFDTGNRRQLRSVQRACRHDDGARLNGVVSVRRYDPARDVFVPAQVGDLGLKARRLVEVERVGDALRMLVDLRR